PGRRCDDRREMGDSRRPRLGCSDHSLWLGLWRAQYQYDDDRLRPPAARPYRGRRDTGRLEIGIGAPLVHAAPVQRLRGDGGHFGHGRLQILDEVGLFPREKVAFGFAAEMAVSGGCRIDWLVEAEVGADAARSQPAEL